MKYISILLLACLTGCGAYPNPYYLTKKELVLKVTSASFVVQGFVEIFGIPIKGGHGTGFYINQNGINYILTAGHVCDHIVNDPALTNRSIAKTGFMQSNPTVAKFDKDVDLCALYFTPPSNITPLKIADSIDFPEEVAAAGYPYSDPFTVTFGYAMNIYKDQLFPAYSTFFTALIHPGNSGGALVNMSGEVVGVVSEGDDRTNTGYAVSLQNIQNFVKGLK